MQQTFVRTKANRDKLMILPNGVMTYESHSCQQLMFEVWIVWILHSPLDELILRRLNEH